MDQTTFSNMLLFSKELAGRPYRYFLYFVKFSKMQDAEPQIYRFFAPNRKVFDAFELGTIYRLELEGHKITAQSSENYYALSDEDFYHLVDARDLMFADEASVHYTKLLSKNYSAKSLYYTFSNYKKLVGFEPTFWHRVSSSIFRFITFFVSFIFPAILYLLFLYASSTVIRVGASASKLFSIPLIAIGSAPFIFWLTYLLFLLSEILLLNIPFTRADVLKSYALKWAGIRKSCHVTDEQKQDIIRKGLITLGVMVVCVLFGYFIL